MRRPPRSTRTDTLFPYTTLFRSDQREIAVGIAFGVEPAARIPVPVPGAADIGRRLYPPDLQPIPGQQIGLIDSGDPRPDHHGIIWAGVCIAHHSASPVSLSSENILAGLYLYSQEHL